MSPQSTIITALIVSAAVLTVKGLREGELSPRTFAGLAVVAFFLLALGQFQPQLGAAFAVLVLVTVLLANADVFPSILQATESR